MANSNTKVIKAAKTLIDTLRELDGTVSEEVHAEAKPVWEKPYDFVAPQDGKLRFRDLAVGDQFSFMGSWPGQGSAPGRRVYTKVSNRKFSFRQGDNVTVYNVRGDLAEVARAVPEGTPAHQEDE